jgi:arylsulfatase A-like enzyme/Flp pilus assembly protein TadD
LTRVGRSLARAGVVAVVVWGSACRRDPGPAPANPPSLLLVTIDTLRADRVAAYGSAGARTPQLDSLAREGVRFQEALTSVPLTLPAHATILSGLEPIHHGVRDNGTYVFPSEPATLATLLRARGYATGAFVGAYVLDRRFGLARGFDVYDDRIDRRGEGASVLESERGCQAVVDAAASWMRTATPPFFAWAHFYDPHAPYDPPAPYREAHAGRPYDGEVAYADACLGQAWAAARARAGSALVTVALADHGEGLEEHGERTHGFFVYRSTLRIPFVLAGPGVPRAEVRDGLARAVDVLPTVLPLVGLPTPPGLDGIDLLRAAAREAYAETLYPLTLGFAPLRSLRVGALKYVDAPTPELYDLAADPGETRNVAAVRTADAARLREALAAARRGERQAGAAVDPAVVERLRALGYVAASAPQVDEKRLLDPKAALPLWRRFETAVWELARGEHASAVRGLRALVSERPENVAFRRSLAAALRAAGHPIEAARALGELARLAPGDAVAWHEQALALDAAGRTAESLAAEERATLLNPLLPEAHNHRGTLLAATGRAADALAAFTEATRLDPNNASAWNNRANALRALRRVAEASVAYRTAIELQPRDPGPRNGLGVLAVEAGDPDAATRLFEEALALDASYAEARLNLAVAEAQRGRLDAARRHAAEAATGATDPAVARRARAFLDDLARSAR